MINTFKNVIKIKEMKILTSEAVAAVLVLDAVVEVKLTLIEGVTV